MDSSVRTFFSRRRSVRPRSTAALLGLFAISCAVKINSFTVAPHEICPGTPVKVDWKVKGGSATLTTNPPLDPQAERTYVPATTTQFIITVKPAAGMPKSKETAATVYTGTASEPEPSEMGFKTRCEGSRLLGSFDRPLAEWDPKLTVGLLESGEDARAHRRARRPAGDVTAEQPSTSAFDGTPLGGPWSVAVPLLASETCDGTGGAPPRLIILTAHVRCGS